MENQNIINNGKEIAMKFNKLTSEQLEMLKDVSKTAIELSKLLGCGVISIFRWRKKIGICVPKGYKKGKSKPWAIKQKTVTCPTCDISFSVHNSSNQKYCSRVCMNQNEEYRLLLKNTDRSYMQTYEYKKTLMKNDTPEYQRYRNKVSKLTEQTYNMHREIINPYNHKRTVAGVENGYHLDHIISCRYGFDNNILPEIISALDNLQMLPWKENIIKGKK